MSKLIFITGPSCAGKSTRFSDLWDTLSRDFEYEDVFREVRCDKPRTKKPSVQIARRFKEVNITLIGMQNRAKTGWVSVDQFKNYTKAMDDQMDLLFGLVKEFERDTVIADGVIRYGKRVLPEAVKEAGISSVDWILILHDDIQEAVRRSFERLKRSGKKSTGGKTRATVESKTKSMDSDNRSAERLGNTFKEQMEGDDKLVEIDANSPIDSITKIIMEK